MADESGHDGIQIDDNHRLVLFRGEQDVIDLRIVVGHPQGKLPGMIQVGQAAGPILHRNQIVDFLPHLTGPPGFILPHGTQKILVALTGIVEARNGFRQLGNVKIRQIHLKFAKGLTGIAHHAHIRHGIEGNGGNVVRHPPEILTVNEVSLSVGGVVEVQGKLSRLFRPDVLRDLVDVVHQTDGIAEGVGIDVLHQKGFWISVWQTEINLVSTVHVAHLNGLVTKIVVFNAEGSGNLQQLLIQVHMVLLSTAIDN